MKREHIMCVYNLIIIIFLNPRKTRVGKKLKKLKRMERLMFRAVVQLKTIVQQNRIVIILLLLLLLLLLY